MDRSGFFFRWHCCSCSRLRAKDFPHTGLVKSSHLIFAFYLRDFLKCNIIIIILAFTYRSHQTICAFHLIEGFPQIQYHNHYISILAYHNHHRFDKLERSLLLVLAIYTLTISRGWAQRSKEFHFLF